jgi:hypothetical protein
LSDVTNIRAKHSDDETPFIHNTLMIRNLLDGNVVSFAELRTLPSRPRQATGDPPIVFPFHDKQCIDFGHRLFSPPHATSPSKLRSESSPPPPGVFQVMATARSLLFFCSNQVFSIVRFRLHDLATPHVSANFAMPACVEWIAPKQVTPGYRRRLVILRFPPFFHCFAAGFLYSFRL